MELKNRAKATRNRNKRPSAAERLGKFQYRISYRAVADGKASEATFCYFGLALARLNYKAILLELYRKKGLEAFAVCLNRYRDPKWRNAIHAEAVEF